MRKGYVKRRKRDEEAMNADNLEKARRFAHEVLTEGHPELFDEMVAESVEAYFSYTVEDYTENREHWRHRLDAVRASLPHHSMEIRNAFSLGDRVYMLLRLTATGKEDEETMVRDGDAIEETLMLRFYEGKIVEAMTFFSRTLGHAAKSGLPQIGWPIAPAAE